MLHIEGQEQVIKWANQTEGHKKDCNCKDRTYDINGFDCSKDSAPQIYLTCEGCGLKIYLHYDEIVNDEGGFEWVILSHSVCHFHHFGDKSWSDGKIIE